MSTIERMTVTMPAEMAAGVRRIVSAGQYASTSEVIREALREWTARRSPQLRELEALKVDIDRGLADLAAGRTTEFDANAIAARGRALFASPTPSA